MGRDNSEISREKVLQKDRGRCRNCHRKASEIDLEIHHIVPRKAGGRDILSNLTTLCVECHRAVHVDDATGPDVSEHKTFDEYPTADNVDIDNTGDRTTGQQDLEDFEG